MALTGKKRAFADAVLAGKSNKVAAVEAGYSAATASPAGSRLAKDKDVQTYLAKRRGQASVAPSGVKDEAAPADWPFGTEPGSRQQAAAPDRPAVILTGEAYLQQVVNDPMEDSKLRVEAAKKLIDFEKAKPGLLGKKESRLAEAKKVGQSGRFSATAPPKLAAANGKRV